MLAMVFFTASLILFLSMLLSSFLSSNSSPVGGWLFFFSFSLGGIGIAKLLTFLGVAKELCVRHVYLLQGVGGGGGGGGG